MKRLLAIILSLIYLFSIFPNVNVSAHDSGLSNGDFYTAVGELITDTWYETFAETADDKSTYFELEHERPMVYGASNESSEPYRGESLYQTKRLVVKSKNPLLDTYGAKKTIRGQENGLTVLQFETEMQTAEVYEKLKRDRTLQFVDVDKVLRINETAQATEHLSWGRAFIKADGANEWLENTVSPLTEITVAVIDTGVYAEHPFLSDRVLDHGINTIDGTTNWADDHNHGTNVSGVVVDNTLENVKILPIKAMSANGSGTDLTVANGITWAADNGANVINLSLSGFGKSFIIKDSIDYAMEQNIAVVAAAGNDSENATSYAPANIPGVITVGSVNNLSKMSSFSNQGDIVDIYAPGESIKTSNLIGEYSSVSGTSFSAPFVAAAGAMLKTYDKKLTCNDIRLLLKKNSLTVNSLPLLDCSGFAIEDFVITDDPLPPSVLQTAGGTGAPDTPYRIANAQQLASIGEDLKLGYKYMYDCFEIIDEIDLSAAAWTPMGDENHPFRGILLGNGHTISGLSIPALPSQNTGLFNSLSGSIIEDLTVDIDTVSSISENTGGIAGEAIGSILANVHVKNGGITAVSSVSGSGAGGLIGRAERAMLIGCGNESTTVSLHQNALVSNSLAEGYQSGGLIGFGKYVTIRNSYSATTTSIISIAGLYFSNENQVGGLIGNGSQIIIEKSYASGEVFGAQNVGGLVGLANYYWISDCYADADLFSAGYVGGLIGYSPSRGGSFMQMCYYAGSLTSNVQSKIGGLAGNAPSGITANYCFWQRQPEVTINACSNWEGTSLYESCEYSFERMREIENLTFWNFGDTWGSLNDINNGLPYLADIGIGKGSSATPPTPKISQGTGSKSNPYIIETPQELNSLAKIVNQGNNCAGLYFEVATDIDLDVAPYNEGKGWIPIGESFRRTVREDYDFYPPPNFWSLDTDEYFYSFNGNINGEGHSIINVYANVQTGGDWGFFGKLKNAKIENLGLVVSERGINIKNGAAFAIEAGEGSLISKCWVTGGALTAGSVASSSFVVINYGTISNCYSTIDIYGRYLSGFMCGGRDISFSGNGTIECEGTLDNCYYSGELHFTTDNPNVRSSRFILWGEQTIRNCYWRSDGLNTGIQDYSDLQDDLPIIFENSQGLPYEDIKLQSSFNNWDFDNIWQIDPAVNDGLPTLRCLPELEILGVSADENDSVKVELSRSLQSGEVLIVAVYDDSNQLLSWNSKPEATENPKIYGISVTIDPTEAKTIKAMWWDDFNHMWPLCDAKTAVKDINDKWHTVVN